MELGPSAIAANVAAVRERIRKAAQRAKRNPDEITLIAVSKGVPAETIREASQAGVQHFGESRVQEWETKAPQLEDIHATWHLVGHLQRNKTARAIILFHAIDSLDSLSLAQRLDGVAGDGRRIPVLLEIRLDPNSTKKGCDPDKVARVAEGLLLLPHLEWRGLMTIPPIAEDPETARPVFRRLREIRDNLVNQFNCGLPELSMGMSHDFEVAIEEGATQVRVGTALFGSRPART